MTAIGSQIGQFIERKLAETALQIATAELAHVGRVTTMGELTASIAHEVNQPLGAMVTSAAACARWLAASPPQIEKAQRALERIVSDGKRAGQVIGRVRSLLKRQTPHKDWLDMNETIQEVVALTRDQAFSHKVTVHVRLAEALPRVWGDKVQLQQVLLNLIINAIEAMSDVDDRRRELIVSLSDGPRGLLVEVRDTGKGMERERAEQLFEAFYTTKAGGIGMGLSISRSIVEAHGGRLWAAPNEPHGAVFRFSLPLEDSPAP
jgi:signal transduction histidine kinase